MAKNYGIELKLYLERIRQNRIRGAQRIRNLELDFFVTIILPYTAKQ